MQRNGNILYFENKQFIQGFLLKKFKFSQVSTDNVRLNVEQQELFNRFTEDGDDLELARTLFEQQKKENFFYLLRRGDTIKVI